MDLRPDLRPRDSHRRGASWSPAPSPLTACVVLTTIHLPWELYVPRCPGCFSRGLDPYTHLEGVTTSPSRWQVRQPARYRLAVPDTDIYKPALEGHMRGEMCRIGPWCGALLRACREGSYRTTGVSGRAGDAD